MTPGGLSEAERIRGEARQCIDAVIASPSRKKLIVAGPGTGKTTLFQQLLRPHPTNNLALTFVNNLVDDLQQKVGEFASCYTLHGYSVGLLHSRGSVGLTHSFEMVPDLPAIISTDSEIIASQRQDQVPEAFQSLALDAHTEFYLLRSTYYDAASFDDAVYRAYDELSSGRWEVPRYHQVVVDEFQDFNPLEGALLNVLQSASPVLVVGDDDQALYPFRGSSADQIRELYADSAFTKFPLPFCGRCTEVIVGAVTDIVEKAQSVGLCAKRVPKRFECNIAVKGEESGLYPKIVHARCTKLTRDHNYPANFIEREIRRFAAAEPSFMNPGVLRTLVICPPKYLRIMRPALETRFPGAMGTFRPKRKMGILDGYRFLLGNAESNIGWRILLQFEPSAVRDPVIRTSESMDRGLIELLPSECLQRHTEVLSQLGSLADGTATGAVVQEVEVQFGMTADQVKTVLGRGEIGEPALEAQPWLALMSFQGAKGLAADLVFVMGLNNGDFPEVPSNPTELEVCSFIVALTRATKKCYLLSNQSFWPALNMQPSQFISWIRGDRIDAKRVDAAYLRGSA